MIDIVRQIEDIRKRLIELETAEPGIIYYRSADVASPPTDEELDSAFGDLASALHNGFLGVLYDSGGGSVYLVAVANGAWYYEQLTAA